MLGCVLNLLLTKTSKALNSSSDIQCFEKVYRFSSLTLCLQWSQFSNWNRTERKPTTVADLEEGPGWPGPAPYFGKRKSRTKRSRCTCFIFFPFRPPQATTTTQLREWQEKRKFAYLSKRKSLHSFSYILQPFSSFPRLEMICLIVVWTVSFWRQVCFHLQTAHTKLIPEQLENSFVRHMAWNDRGLFSATRSCILGISSFQRNCGAASVGELNKNLVLSNELMKVEFRANDEGLTLETSAF